MTRTVKEITESYAAQGVKLENLENLFNWFIRNHKAGESLNLEACIEDVIRQHGETGADEYELSKFESKSKNPEIYRYEFSFEYDEENDEILSETYSF